jgi:hypothetical protein
MNLLLVQASRPLHTSHAILPNGTPSNEIETPYLPLALFSTMQLLRMVFFSILVNNSAHQFGLHKNVAIAHRPIRCLVHYAKLFDAFYNGKEGVVEYHFVF